MVVMSGKRIKQVCHLVATAGVRIGIAVHEKYFLPMQLAHIRINSAERLGISRKNCNAVVYIL